MSECLYHPEFGYYNSPAATARLRDYYTSVDLHPIFGRLLARQLAEMWELLGRPAPFLAAELGAGTGKLAAQILDFAGRALPEFAAALHYIAVEQSAARRRALAQVHARGIAEGRLSAVELLPPVIPAGCIFSNEFFDALPVHRVSGAPGGLQEIFVALDGEQFVEQHAPLSSPALGDYFSGQGITLAGGQQAEACLLAGKWIEEVGRSLQRGFLLTIDYGHSARQLYDEHHRRGTLLAYRHHRASEDFFAAPGEQDLTAHVNFTALEMAGRRCGLETAERVSQSAFLMALGRANEFADLCQPGDTEAVRVKSRLQLKSLIYPEGMGEMFSVLIQYKGVSSPHLTGLQPL